METQDTDEEESHRRCKDRERERLWPWTSSLNLPRLFVCLFSFVPLLLDQKICLEVQLNYKCQVYCSSSLSLRLPLGIGKQKSLTLGKKNNNISDNTTLSLKDKQKDCPQDNNMPVCLCCWTSTETLQPTWSWAVPGIRAGKRVFLLQRSLKWVTGRKGHRGMGKAHVHRQWESAGQASLPFSYDHYIAFYYVLILFFIVRTKSGGAYNSCAAFAVPKIKSWQLENT